MSTHFLNLNLPATGTTGWGAQVNQNWTIIDRYYAQLKQNILALEDKLTDLGTFTYIKLVDGDGNIETINWAQFVNFYIEAGGRLWHYKPSSTADGSYTIDEKNPNTTDKYSGTTGGVILGNTKPNQDGSFDFVQTKQTGYDGIYALATSGQQPGLDALNDYTAFQVIFPELRDKNEDLDKTMETNVVKYYAFGEEWLGNDIMVKTSAIQNNKRQTVIRKFDQGLGGYYTPTVMPGSPNVIEWNKTTSSSARQLIRTTLPINAWAGIRNKQEFSNATIIDTGIKSKYIASSYTYESDLADIQFFIKEDNNYIRVYVDYTVDNTSDNLKIKLSTNLPDNSLVTYVAIKGEGVVTT